MKILILTGKFGLGHWSASQSLRQQISRDFPRAETEVLDFFAYAMPNSSEALYKAFDLLVTYGYGLFNAYYRMADRLPSDTHSPLDRPMLDKLEELLWEKRPDAVIATHPICAGLVSRYKEESGDRLPLVTCVTDLSTHNEWLHSRTDGYLVGSREIKERLMEKGVEAGRIHVTGIPVKEEFRTISHRRGGGERRLLIMGGGLGLLPKKDSFYDALDELPGVRTTILTGHNQRLYQRLSGRYEHIEVVGFTDRVWEYMEQADLMRSPSPAASRSLRASLPSCPCCCGSPFSSRRRTTPASCCAPAWLGRRPRSRRSAWRPSRDCSMTTEPLGRCRPACGRASGNCRLRDSPAFWRP